MLVVRHNVTTICSCIVLAAMRIAGRGGFDSLPGGQDNITTRRENM